MSSNIGSQTLKASSVSHQPGVIAKFAFGGGGGAGGVEGGGGNSIMTSSTTLPKYHQSNTTTATSTNNSAVQQAATVQDLVAKFGQGLLINNNINASTATNLAPGIN